MVSQSNLSSRRGFISASAALLASSAVARRSFGAAATEPASRPAMFAGKLEAKKLEEDLVVIFGAGGNVAAHFDADRFLVIDSGVAQRAPELLRLLHDLSSESKSRTLVNTHWHGDHTGGDSIFTQAGFHIVSTGKCRERLGQSITSEDMKMSIKPMPEAARPTVTFDTTLKLYEASEITLTRIEPAHTDTDAVVFFEKYNVLHTGDLLFSGMWPVIDRATGGTLDGMIASSRRLVGMIDDKARVIPGHGLMGDRATLAAQLQLLETVHERLAPLGEKKKTMKEVLEARPLADLDEKWGTGFFKSDFVTPMYYGQWLTR